MLSIDLNADLGEGFGRYRLSGEAELLQLVSSASIACGFHAGDPIVMRETVGLAAQRGVVIGAHPGYPDLTGFGRRELQASPEEISAYVLYQIGALAAFCTAAGTRLRYVKPHGALYHRAGGDSAVAQALAEAVHAADPALAILALENSELTRAARALGLETANEAFVDRAYRPDGSLLPRSEAGALLTDVEAVVQRAVRMVRDHYVVAVDGTRCLVHPDSLCVHGDGSNAVAIVRALRARLQEEGITIEPFVS
jgi:UPF0271 protein